MSQPIRVFISYSHDDDAHREFVLRLANRLRTEQGIECLLDQHFLPGFPPQGWTKWMRDSVRDAKHVLMVCTPKYRNRYERNLENLEDTGRGVAFEGVVISQTLYEDYFHNHGLKFIPVLPSNGKRDDVPRELRDFSIYTLPDAFQQVCDLIRGVQYNPLPPLGSPPVRDTLETRVDTYLDWVQNTFLRSMDAYTAMDGKKRVRAQPQVRRKRFIVDDDFSALDKLRPGCSEQQVLEEKTFDNILDALSETGQGVFLGKPGAGKTTTLWKIASDEIIANNQRTRNQRIVPIILRLGFWIEPWKSLQEFIRDKTNVVEKMLGEGFSELLEQNRVLLVLDGLNEMPVMWQKDKGREIREFLTSNKQMRAYASCREDDYTDDVRQPLPELHIQPLNIPRIKTFIQHYLETDEVSHATYEADKLFWDIAGGTEVREVWQKWETAGATDEQFWEGKDFPENFPSWDKFAEIWRRNVRDNPHNLIRLARNPYLLAMLMSVCAPGEPFPSNRGALLEGFYRQLVKRERNRNRQKDNAGLLNDGGTQLESLIGKLAWSMAEQTKTSSSHYATLDIMEHDEQWLKLAIRCNVLEQIGENIRFSHQLLQDYFIAVGMKQRLNAGELPVERFWQQPGNWWESTGWEEPVILLAGLYQDCTPVVEWLAQANPKLAARCIRDSGVACSDVTKAKLREPWQERLTNLVTDPNPYARAAIGTALAWVELHGRPLDQRKGIGLDSNGLPDIDWVEIPAGEFVYQDGETRTLPTFKISRYPVTNTQFQAFIADGGYRQGLKNLETAHESYWNEGNRPVEQVSWYEAMAFCRWLSSKMKLDISLPTEEQWEKASRGTNGHEYPWGNGYKVGYANIDETALYVSGYASEKVGDIFLGETSAVGIYPNGQSHYGLMDMSGNVLEWCLNKWEHPNDIYEIGLVIRGGFWGSRSGNCRSSSRSFRHPHNRFNFLGFRLCCVRVHTVYLLFPHKMYMSLCNT